MRKFVIATVAALAMTFGAVSDLSAGWSCTDSYGWTSANSCGSSYYGCGGCTLNQTKVSITWYSNYAKLNYVVVKGRAYGSFDWWANEYANMKYTATGYTLWSDSSYYGTHSSSSWKTKTRYSGAYAYDAAKITTLYMYGDGGYSYWAKAQYSFDPTN